MTQDDIIRMALEAGFEGLLDKAWGIEQLKRFAALVAAHEREKHLNLANQAAWSVALAEREACAKVCEKNGEEWADGNNDWCSGQVKGSYDCAEAIRARGDK